MPPLRVLGINMIEFRLSRRKIVKAGYTAYICLPKIWLSNNKLHVGDDVETFALEDGSLRIAATKKSGEPGLEKNTNKEA